MIFSNSVFLTQSYLLLTGSKSSAKISGLTKMTDKMTKISSNLIQLKIMKT